jgi:type IV pilus assembly protein PilB
MALSVLTKSEAEKKASLLDALRLAGSINDTVLQGIKSEITSWPELKDLATYLESHNIVNRLAINIAMAKVLNLPFTELSNTPDLAVMKIIPKSACVSYEIIACKKENNKVTVAVANPARIKENKRGVLSEIKGREKLQFTLVVTSPDSFSRWISVYPDENEQTPHLVQKEDTNDSAKLDVNAKLLQKIPVAIANKYRMFVYGQLGESYLLAVEDPDSEKVKSAIKFISDNNKIKFIVKKFDKANIDYGLSIYDSKRSQGLPENPDRSAMLKIPKAVAIKYRFVVYKLEKLSNQKPKYYIATDRDQREEDKRIWHFIEEHNNVNLIIEKFDSVTLDKWIAKYDEEAETLKLPDANVAKWLLPAPMNTSNNPLASPSTENNMYHSSNTQNQSVDKGKDFYNLNVNKEIANRTNISAKAVNPTPITPQITTNVTPAASKNSTIPFNDEVAKAPKIDNKQAVQQSVNKEVAVKSENKIKPESGFHKAMVSLGLAHASRPDGNIEPAIKAHVKKEDDVVITQFASDSSAPALAPVSATPPSIEKDDSASARLGSGTFNVFQNVNIPSTSIPPVNASPITQGSKVNIPIQSDKSNSIAPPASQQESGEEDDLGSLLNKDVQTVEELQKIIVEGFIPRMVAAIVSYAITLRASDVHIEAELNDVRIRYRVDGMLQDVIRMPLEQHAAIVSRIKILAKLKIDETRIPQDGRFDVKFKDRAVDLRVSSMPTVHGEKIVLRILDKTHGILSLEDLGVVGRAFDIIIEGIKRPYGIVLSTGPTGSGKSTTLYAILNRISTPTVNIITLEDPVEYEIAGVNQAQIKPKIGFTFAEGLRSVLRQDPNVVMVGEIRDSETANMATHAALTGHLVLSTLHTNDAPGALPRLINMGVEPFLITSSINAIMGQRLVRRVCQSCKEPAQIPPAVIAEIQAELNKIPENNPKDRARIKPELVFYHGKGCERCQNGYKGRIGIYEVMSMSDAIEDLAIKKAATSEIQKQAITEGMITMKQDGLLKALEGMTTVDEVLRETAV